MPRNKPQEGILPTGKRAPRTRLRDYSHGIYGPPGIGKTTWANDWQGAVFAATEPGTAALHAAEREIRSWEDFIVFLDAVENEAHSYDTVVIDTVDLLHHFCRASVCRQLGIGHPSEAAYAKGWDLMKDRWVGGINRAARLTRADGERVCTLFVAHEKTTPLTESREGKVIDTGRSLVTTNLSTGARGVLHSALDFLYHAEFATEDNAEQGICTGDRIIRTQPAELPHARIEAKGRGSLEQRLPDLLPLNFGALARSFHTTFNGGNER